MKKINFLYYSFIFILVVSCKPDVDEFEASAGDANFSKYVAVGNSLTSGYANGALYISGQQNSFPNILAQQFAKVGGGGFNQPYMLDENGIGVIGTTPVTKRVLGSVTDCKGVTSLGPVFAGSPNLGNFASIAAQGPFNNMGVPGVKSFQTLSPLLGTPGTGNPFYVRIATKPGTSTVIGDAKSQNPTFFTVWLGNNDVLGYALSGGDQGGDAITDQTTFAGSIKLVLDSLTVNGAKGAIANIPDITTIPYFNTVPYNGLVLTRQGQVDSLNGLYALLGLPSITFKLGQNPFVIADATASKGRRQINSNEFILLTVPQDSIKCFNWGSQVPIPAKYVLDETEISKVNTAITGYNGTIFSFATSYNLALVDAFSLIRSLKTTGLTFNAIDFSATYVTGGAFSLDGIHLTPRGYAIVANKFIESINWKYNSRVPQVNITDYEGLRFP